jgi:hypothetical protein
MKRLVPIVIVVLFLSGCLSGTGVPSGQRCVVSFDEITASSTVEVTQVIENDGRIEISYETNRTVATVELIAGGTSAQTNSTVPPGTHVVTLPTEQLEKGNATLRATNPKGEPVAEYRIITTGCSGEE